MTARKASSAGERPRRAPFGRGGRRRAAGLIAAALACLLPLASQGAYTVDDQRTGKRLNMIAEHLQAEQYAEAEQLLNGFTMTRLNPYERALVYQMWGYLHAGREDYPKAAEAFEKALVEQALPEEQAVTMRFNIAQLYMAMERWSDAIVALENWFAATPEPNSNAYYTLAIAYYQKSVEDDLPEYREKALEPARKAVDLAKTPQERWLQLLLALYLENKQYKESLPVLEQVVSLYPKKLYWLQLSAIYSELGMEKEYLATQQLAYHQGLLDKGKELQRMAELYLYYDLPYRAAQVLEQAFESGTMEEDKKTLELYANSLLAAKEYDTALAPLERAAALSDKGDLFLRLGQVYASREEWGKAEQALRSALEKGELKHLCNVQLMLGMTTFYQGRPDNAREWFERASRDESCAETSRQWTAHVDRETQRGGG